jgi:2'-5' RNA ligase
MTPSDIVKQNEYREKTISPLSSSTILVSVLKHINATTKIKNTGNTFKKDSHDGYTPHITMGYNVKEGPDLIKEFNGIPIIVDNITLWGYAPKVNKVHIANTLYRINLK